MFDTTSTTITQRWSSICMMYVGSWWKMNDWQHWTMFRLKKIIHTHLCVQCTCIYVYIVQCFDYQRHYILLDILQQCSRGCSQVHSHYSTFFLLYFDNAESFHFSSWLICYGRYSICMRNLLLLLLLLHFELAESLCLVCLFVFFVSFHSSFLFLNVCVFVCLCVYIHVYIYVCLPLCGYYVYTITYKHTNHISEKETLY